MNRSARAQLPQDRFSVFWGVAGKGGRAGEPQDSAGGTDPDCRRGILRPAAAGERVAGLRPSGALPGQEGEK